MSMNRGPSAVPGSASLSSAALRGAVDLSALAERAARTAKGQMSEPAAGAEEASAPSPFVVDVNDAGFEQFMQLSGQVICLVGFYADQVPGSREIIEELVPLVNAQGGRIALGRVRGEDAPGVFQAFQLQAVPAAVALIKGQPVPIYQGTPPQDWDAIFTQLKALGDEHGVTATIPGSPAAGAPGDDVAPAEPQLSPEEQAAYEALERQDYSAAQAIYREVLASRPADADAKRGLLNAQLLERLHELDAAGARARAAESPDDLEAHLAVADLDLFNGYVEDAFTRLVRFVALHGGDERETARQRLVDFFDLVGAEHQAVPEARRKLAAALF
jgi:putative thioredoxin